jgi:ribosomal protein S18 acetylase RimI-like enzyme
MATKADLPRLMEVINAAYSIESFLEGTRTDMEHLPACLETGIILLLEDIDGKILASIYAERRGVRGYLGMLAVDPAYQNRGFAQRLVAAAEEHFRKLGCPAIDIHVLSLRRELLPLYRRFGFVETGTEAFNYPRTFRGGVQCHCIVMTKHL